MPQAILPMRVALAVKPFKCQRCGSCEIWVLDCHVGCECPNGIDSGVHYHYRCGRCDWEEREEYSDE